MVSELNTPPAGWFILDIMRRGEGRKWDWVALMIDVDPDDVEKLPRLRAARQCWVRIAGKHRNRDDAWTALEDLMATRH